MPLMWDENGINLDELIDAVLEFKKFMTPAQMTRIRNGFGTAESTLSFGADFDLLKEVQEQISAARALRREHISNGAVLTTAKEAQSALQATTGLIKLLVDLQKDVINLARQQAVEAATVDTLKVLSPEAVEKYRQLMEERLENAP